MDEAIKEKTDFLEKAVRMEKQITIVKGILELVGAMAVKGKLKDKTDFLGKDIDTRSIGPLLLDASERMDTIQALSQEMLKHWRNDTLSPISK
jgi:DNA-binding ferritin-like protein (Dps family)